MPPKPTAVKREKLSKAPLSSWVLTIATVQVAVLATAVAALLTFPLKTGPIVQLAPFVTLADGRNISYELRGEAASTYTLLYLHRSASSRLEASFFDEGMLRGHSIRVLSIDRPGYGESTPHKEANLTTFAEDVEQLASALKLHKLLVAGTSVGATYALALAAHLPDRVQAALLISPSGSTLNTGDLSAEEFAQLSRDAEQPGSRYPVHSLLRRVAQHPKGAELLKAFAQAPLAGRLLYQWQLAHIRENVTSKVDPADRACILSTQPQMAAAYKEGLYQRTAAPYYEDITTVLQPLPFNLSRMLSPQAQARISIVASQWDSTVPDVFAKSLKRRLPGVKLRLLEAAGHIGFLACDAALQGQLLGELLVSSCSDHPASTGCTGWAASGECSKNPAFMLDNCKKSCGVCHYTKADVARVIAAPCADLNDSCPGWAEQGECERNRAFMWGVGQGNCRKSCHKCHVLSE